MAFSGTYISQMRKIVHGKSNLAATHQQSTSSQTDDVTSSSVESQPADNNSNEYTAANYPGVLDSDLTSLTTAQRNIFIVILTMLFVLSMCGNMCTFFVNFRRKIRPFFRACLISLAFSDLMNTVFLTTAYLSQFTAEYVQIWRLGNIMCSLVPFATTSAILAGSMTLVGIAVDRYFAVMKAVTGFWNPSAISCIVCMLCIWLISIGISFPVFTIYDLIPVYILTEEHETANVTDWPTTTAEVALTHTTTTSSLTRENGIVFMMPKIPSIAETTKKSSMTAEIATGTKSPWEIEASQEVLSYTLVSEQRLVNVCVSNQKNVSLYYVIVFVIIFIPCIGAFFWFNSIIARKLWKRRHVADLTKKGTDKSKCQSKLKTTSTPAPTKTPKTEQPKGFYLQSKNCNCKLGQSSSATVPSSVANTLGGKVILPAATSVSTTTTCNVNTNSSRETRHLRMFTIILLMMAVFVFLRLPAWVFLLMRMYGSYTKPGHWVLYFAFGLMNLASSVLNPLFYTFLSEAIQYTLRFKSKVSALVCGYYSKLCRCSYCTKYGTKSNNCTSFIPPNNKAQCNTVLHRENNKVTCHGTMGCCESLCGCCSFLRASLSCYRPRLESENIYEIHSHSLQHECENRPNKSEPATNNDKDEGVECNDEMDEEDVCDFCEYNQRIYTIFPPSLVSSSINSQFS